jgi:hypothetical protein
LSVQAYFDLANGSVGATVAGDNDDQGIIDVGGGWYRCWVSFTTDGVDENGSLRIYVANADGDVDVSRANDSSIFFWGAQLENGPGPSSYIRTDAGTASRNVDDISTADISWLTEDQGSSWYSRHTKLGVLEESRWVFWVGSLSDYYAGGANFAGTAHQARAFVTTGDDGQVASGSLLVDTEHEMAFGHELNDLTLYVDGAFEGQDTTTGYPQVAGQSLHIGDDSNGGNEWNGIISELRYYDERLDNGTLEDMSNGIFPSAAFGHAPRVKRANDAALWYHQMRLKQEDEEALKLIREILG